MRIIKVIYQWLRRPTKDEIERLIDESHQALRVFDRGDWIILLPIAIGRYEAHLATGVGSAAKLSDVRKRREWIVEHLVDEGLISEHQYGYYWSHPRLQAKLLEWLNGGHVQ